MTGDLIDLERYEFDDHEYLRMGEEESQRYVTIGPPAAFAAAAGRQSLLPEKIGGRRGGGRRSSFPG